jgi:hypothetical protein
MYLINKNENKIEKVAERTFSELGFKERENLQEWIANNPDCLGEDLLIIQKEFDGFNDTNERLDLLALDKQGNIVVIENKLDDSGKDVTWQVLKYASYCSSLTKNQLKDIYQKYLDKVGKNENAVENLSDFFSNVEFNELQLNQGTSQRIIMIAGNFRKEVTSTALWLMNYKLRIQCFKVTPYTHIDNIYLDIEQIIPMQDVEDYVISMADKAQEDIETQESSKARHGLRVEFWTRYLRELNKTSDLYKNISPSKDNWIGTGSGLSGVSYNSVIANYYARVEVYISRASKEENKSIFDALFQEKVKIENTFGHPLIWERLDNKKACRIKFELQNVDYFNEEDWEQMISFMAENLPKLSLAFTDSVKLASIKIKK